MTLDRHLRMLLQDNCDFLETIPQSYPYLHLELELIKRIRQAVDEVRRKIDSSKVQLAIVGGFSSGKSTLINALLGTQLLAARVTPTTICPTYITRGDRPRVLIRGRWQGAEQFSSGFLYGDMKIKVKQKGYPDTAMKDLGDGVLAASVKFRKPGVYDVWVVSGAANAGKIRVPVLDCSNEVIFYYHLLSGCFSHSGTYFHLSADNLPQVTVTCSQYKLKYNLRCCDLSNRWSTVVDVPMDKVSVNLEFAWDWFTSQNAKKTQKREPKGFWDSVRRIFSEISSYEMVKLCAGHPLTSSFELDNHTGEHEKTRVTLDLNKAAFTHDTPNTLFVREFRLKNRVDLAQAANVIGLLTSTGTRGSEGADFSGVVEDVIIKHPSVRIDEAVTIIDTPGIAAESDHTVKTINIVRDKADACLFLCPADQAATLKDLQFVEDNLMNVVGDIAFLITKADKAANDEELEELVGVVGEKIEGKLGIKNPYVLTVSALQALDDGHPGDGQFKIFIQIAVAFDRHGAGRRIEAHDP